MNIGIYSRRIEAIAAVSTGLSLAGYKVEPQTEKYFSLQDVKKYLNAVIVWNGVSGYWGEVARAYRAVGIKVIVVENSLYRRPGLFQISSGLNVLPEKGSKRRANKLGMTIKSTPTIPIKTLLVLGQVPNDSQHRLTESQLYDWYRDSVGACRKIIPSLMVVWRPHPRWQRWNLGFADRDSITGSLDTDLAMVEAVLTYNSSSAIDALLQGKWVFSSPMACFAQATAIPGAQPACSIEAVTDVLNRIAASTFSLEEMKCGGIYDGLLH